MHPDGRPEDSALEGDSDCRRQDERVGWLLNVRPLLWSLISTRFDDDDGYDDDDDEAPCCCNATES